MQVCSGLRAIHKSGLVHRDLKPKNILLTAQGIVKIVNLGVRLPPSAFHLPRDSGAVKFYDFTNGLRRRVSESEDISGTFDYLSPEQLAQGGRSSLRHLLPGVIAYELLTGEIPFGELSLPNLMWKKSHSVPDSPHLSRTDCPAELAEVVMKALARDPGSRYATAAEMFADLSKIEQAIVRGGHYRLYLRTLKLLFVLASSLVADAVSVSGPMGRAHRVTRRLRDLGLVRHRCQRRVIRELRPLLPFYVRFPQGRITALARRF